jgi:integrase
MSLVKKGNKWISYITVNGIRYRRATGTSNRRQAEAIDRQYREELNAVRRRVPTVASDMTFGALSARFIASGMSTPYSQDRLSHLLGFFADVLVKEITLATVREYRQGRHREKSLKAATVNRDLSVLRRVLNWSAEEGLLQVNPLGRLPMERERRTKRTVMSVREEQLLMAASPEHLQRIILCALDTGMRRGEIFSQRWEDLDFDNRILHVTHSKTSQGEGRDIPLTDRLYQLLASFRKVRGPVFTYEGNPIKIVKTTWASSLRRSGIRHMRFHDLRHTANTRMMLAGVLQEVRREIIGHSSQRSRDVNDRYTQIELPEKREAIHKLEVWLESQALLLREAEAAPMLLMSGDQTTTKEQPDDSNEHSTSAA